MTSKKTYTRPDTVLAVAGRDPDNNFGIVNPPVYHASTILSPTMDKFENRIPFEGYGYGRNGTPTQKALEDAVAAIEGAHRSIAVQSGLAAVTGAIVGFLKTGDHMLVTDNAYGPARRFANTTLKGFGVETTYFDPMIGGEGLAKLMRPNTKVVYLEAPGSQTFEVQDVDRHGRRRQEGRRGRPDRQHLGDAALLQAVRPRLRHLRPRRHQVHRRSFRRDDGHHLLRHARHVRDGEDGLPVVRLPRRARRLLPRPARPAHHGRAPAPSREERPRDRQLAEEHGPRSTRCCTPPCPTAPATRTGRSSSRARPACSPSRLRDGIKRPAVAAMLDGMDIFGMGASWGGYESLMIPAHPDQYRTAVPWPEGKQLLRVHIGLEDVEDLKTDLAEGFERLNRAHNA